MYPELVFKKKGNCHSQFVLRRSSWKSGHKADREEILKLLCGGGGGEGGSEIRVRVPISVEALKCMQESKLFECRPQELDEKFVNRTIRKDETVYTPFTCSSI